MKKAAAPYGMEQRLMKANQLHRLVAQQVSSRFAVLLQPLAGTSLVWRVHSRDVCSQCFVDHLAHRLLFHDGKKF